MTAPTTRADHAELARAIERLLPITTRDTPDYAEVSFGECQAQAMTMEPDTWLALNQLPALLSEIAALRGERDRLKLAICGGEDVPGAIDAVTVDDCEGFIREERQRHDGLLTQAERQRDELRKALEPFAEAAESLDDETRDHDHIWEQPAAMSIDAGHLRAARALLANQGADQ